MSKQGEPNLIFNVFDTFEIAPGEKKVRPYVERANLLQQWIFNNQREHGGRLHYWQQVDVEDADHVRRMLDTWEAAGYEGLILRDPQSGYKFGRSTLKEGWLMKLKRFEDAEAKIIGFEELLQNTNEATTRENGKRKRSSKKENMVAGATLGNLLVKDVKTGVEFSVGSGLGEKIRLEIWENQKSWKNKIIKYKFQPSGTNEKPRFPVYLGVRGKADI